MRAPYHGPIRWDIPYSRKIWWGIKFGGLAVYITTAKISYTHIRMAIPCRTTKFKFANILVIAILGSTAKFNSRHFSGYTVTVIARVARAT